MPFTKDRSIYVSTRRTLLEDWWDHVPTLTASGGSLKLTRSRTGDAVKDWRKRIARQQNATSDMSGTFDSMEVTNAFQVAEMIHLNFNFDPPDPQDKFYSRQTGYIAPSYTLSDPSLSVSEARNRAAIAFLKRCRSVQSEFSSPTFLGELRETLRMIRNPAQGLRNLAGNFLSDVKRRKKRAPKEWKKNLSSMWLEQAFGWTPLISSISDGYDAYQNLVNTKDNEQRLVSGYGIEEKEVTPTTYSDYSSFAGSILHWATTTNVVDKAFYKYRGMVVRRVDATLRDKLARVGFNAEEFIPTVWELLPWSFLIDYFTNIGDVLQANAFVRSDLAWVASTQVRTRTRRVLSQPETPAQAKKRLGKWYVTSSAMPVSVVLTRRVVQRSAAGALVPPSLSFELPGRPAQFANMTALFAQANSIHPQRRPR